MSRSADVTAEAAPTVSKSQRTYEWVRERILSREFSPGYRLVLGAIAAELEVSAVPVREAVRRLEAEGLVEFEKNVGARVATIDEAAYHNTMETLGALEGVATALALPLLTTSDLDRAEALNAEMRRLLEDFDPVRFTSLNEQFHRVLFVRCPNPHIGELVGRGWNRLAGLRRSTFSFVPARAKESVAEHQRILELIRTGADALDVEMAVRHHRWKTVSAYREASHSTP
ncbi:GntR family transcriptional regulator [Nesterenkonia marinintestina]|uniref:GntR family transcriptional regulator n=1 Tax=Nesterenkonia marinintestina TaxID=2979865 RepID=UPI0021C0C350|nr:GntR family transcriptional regulator [Nesterenkonia sp. GX14115]